VRLRRSAVCLNFGGFVGTRYPACSYPAMAGLSFCAAAHERLT